MTFLSCTLTPGNEIFRGVVGGGSVAGTTLLFFFSLVWEIIKTRNTGVSQRSIFFFVPFFFFKDAAHYASAPLQGLVWHRSAAASALKLSPRSLCCLTPCACVCVCVCACVSDKEPDESEYRWPEGSLAEEEESCFLRFPPLAEVFYPLMNWDCWSKVWIIEFLINYPELLSDKSAPLQPPSSPLLFYLIWSASCSPGLTLRRPCLINTDLVVETDAAAWLLLRFDVSRGFCAPLFFVSLLPNSSSEAPAIRSRTTWKPQTPNSGATEAPHSS